MRKISVLIHSRKEENVHNIGIGQTVWCSDLIPVFEQMTFDCFDLFDFLLTFDFFLFVECFLLEIAQSFVLSVRDWFNNLEIFLVLKRLYVV